uniref:Uncharacterized protein n=1 Tax=Arundo donax TaxID=35708 RepID=A0A0A8Y6G5_ARUDO
MMNIMLAWNVLPLSSVAPACSTIAAFRLAYRLWHLPYCSDIAFVPISQDTSNRCL